MQAIKPTLRLFTNEEGQGIFFTSLIMKHRGNAYHLHASTKDTIYIYEESIALYILTINKITGTIGLSSYMQPEPFPINSFYMHNEKHIKAALGHGWEKMLPETIVEKLMDLLI